MKLVAVIRLVISSFRQRKSRIILTVVGVSVAISTVLFLVALGYGLQRMFLNKITTQESLLTLNITPTRKSHIDLNDKSLEKIKKIPNVEIVSPNAFFTSQISFKKFISQSTLNVITPSFLSLAGDNIIGGKSFNKNIKNTIVINSGLTHLLDVSNYKNIIGKNVSLVVFINNSQGINQPHTLKEKFKIIGVVNDGYNMPQIYMRNSDTDFPITSYQSAKVKIKDSQSLTPVRNKLIKIGFSVSSVSDIIDQANKVFGFITTILTVFGIVAVVVAAIGLLNTMTVSLLERTSQIGVMRAIGASPSDIKKLFLIESSIIGFLGGVSGILLGIIISQLFNWFINLLAGMLGGQAIQIFYFPFWFIIFIIFFSTFIGIIGGLFPARRAAKLDPLEALRYK